MSFSSEIKHEIAYNELRNCCSKAQLSALMQLCSSLSISASGMAISYRSENPTVAKRALSLLKNLYGIKSELNVYQKANLKKNNIYELKFSDNAIEILKDLSIYTDKGLADYPRYDVVKKECCARAYIAGCFLAYGSCNAPGKSDYHLEIVFNEESTANFVIRQIKRFNINAKLTKRRNKNVVYIKKADEISDFLRLIGAQESLMNFENTRISRDFINSKIRLDNCDIANMQKSLQSAKAQIAAIEKLQNDGKLDKLDTRLQDVARLRLVYPEESLSELCKEYERIYRESISRSGLKHRFDKLISLAGGEK